MQARITLARAVYSDAEILLFDDVSQINYCSPVRSNAPTGRFWLPLMFTLPAGSSTNVSTVTSCVDALSFWW